MVKQLRKAILVALALAAILTACAVVMSLFHLYAAVRIVPAYILRPVHVAMALTLVFLLCPAAPRFRHRLRWAAADHRRGS